MERGNSVKFHADVKDTPRRHLLEKGSSVRFGSTYRLLKVPSAKNLGQNNNRKEGGQPILDVQRPVWFYVEVQQVQGGTNRDSRGPYTIEDLRQKWLAGTIDGDTMVWTADKPYFDWEPIDSVSHRKLKEALLRPLLPPLHGSGQRRPGDDSSDDEVEDEDDPHLPEPLKVLDVANLCSECGVVASVQCRRCKDIKTEVVNGLASRVGSLSNAVEIMPGFLWMGDKTAASRSVIEELGITHLINATEELPNKVLEDFEVSAAMVGAAASVPDPEDGTQPQNKEVAQRLEKKGTLKKLGRMRDRVAHTESSIRSLSPAGSSKRVTGSSPRSSKRLTATSPRRSGRNSSRSPSPRPAPQEGTTPAPAPAPAGESKPVHRRGTRRISHMQVALGGDTHQEDLLPSFDKVYHYLEMIRQQNLGRSIRPQGKGAPQTVTSMAQYRVLIMSNDGRCRAPAIVMSYLIRAWGFQYEQAYKIVTGGSPNVELSLDAMGKLLAYAGQYSIGRCFCGDCFKEHHGQLQDYRGTPSTDLLTEAGKARGRKVRAFTRGHRLTRIDCSGEVFKAPDKASGFCKALGEVHLTLGMTSLDLTGSGLGDGGVRTLTESFLMTSRPSLTALCLGSNRLSDDSLAVLINTLNFVLTGTDRIRLTHLDISNNFSEAKTCQAIYDYLKDEDCLLVCLNMKGNDMKDQAVVKVIDALSPPEFHELMPVGTAHMSTGSKGMERAVLKAQAPGDGADWSFHVEGYIPGPELTERQQLANATLTSLDLGCNELGQASYHRLKHAVRDHRTFCHLSLGGSSHPASGEEEMLEFLRYMAIYSAEITYLNLSHMALDNQACEALARFIGDESCHLARLDLSDNAFTAVGMKSLASALVDRNQLAALSGAHLTSLDLSSTPIGTEGVVALAEAFLVDDRRRMAIADLEISGCGIGPNGFLALARVLEMPQCPLRFLNLSDNKHGGLEGITRIGRALTVNKGLTCLSLASTGVTMEGAKVVAQCLGGNHDLLELDLSRNEIRDVGAKAFAELFKSEENHSLRSLDLSFTAIGDDGVASLYSALKTTSESSRDMVVRDLHLSLTGNHATLDLTDYAPDLKDSKRYLAGYDTVIVPRLAKSKQTLAYSRQPYTDPVLDTCLWSRPKLNQKKEEGKARKAKASRP